MKTCPSNIVIALNSRWSFSSLLLYLSVNTFLLERAVRISHVHLSALVTCHALRPRERPMFLPFFSAHGILPSDNMKSSANPYINISGLNHFSISLRPATSMSTLNLSRYRHRSKTRCGVRWVRASPVELSSTSRIGASWRTMIYCAYEGMAVIMNAMFIIIDNHIKMLNFSQNETTDHL